MKTAAKKQLTMGRFIVRRWLGSGLHGKIFQAFDPILERQVAIKWLNSTATEISSPSLSIYSNEALIVAKLRHPNIVTLYEAGMHCGFPFLVFDYVEGTTLREKRLRGEVMPLHEAIAIFRGILDGVACDHAHGILHLDLSPGNIMIDTAGAPHIMDFGLAKLARASVPGIETNLEQSSVIGSPMYMSPEQFKGEVLTARSDVFSLGLILCEMLTGRSPIKVENLQELIATIGERPLDLQHLGQAGLDIRLQTLIRHALNYAPELRFADAGEFKLAFEELVVQKDPKDLHSTVEFLLNRMKRKANFPALSNNLIEINRLTAENSTANSCALSSVVLRDYAITNKLLKLANSSFYGRTSLGVKTVSDAIQLLGMNVIRLTCNGLVYFNAMKSEDHNLQDALISSFVAALIGRHFAIRLGRQDLAEEAFICGMFHRLGKSLTIFYFNEEFHEIERLLEECSLEEEAASAQILGISYSSLGRSIAARWKFPETIQQSIQYPGPGPLRKPLDSAEIQQQIAAFANEYCELAARAPVNQRTMRLNEFSIRFAELIDISPAELVELLHSAFEKLKEFAPVLGLDLP
jgi:serine/threonine protein kinase